MKSIEKLSARQMLTKINLLFLSCRLEESRQLRSYNLQRSNKNKRIDA